MMIVPCGLHLILAHHRYLWKFMFDILVDRKQQDLIPNALRLIDCHYLAFQIQTYHERLVLFTFKSKNAKTAFKFAL